MINESPPIYIFVVETSVLLRVKRVKFYLFKQEIHGFVVYIGYILSPYS